MGFVGGVLEADMKAEGELPVVVDIARALKAQLSSQVAPSPFAFSCISYHDYHVVC